MEGETKRKQGFLCHGDLFGLNLRRGLELACQRSVSLPPELKAGNNVRNIFTERRSLLQGFPSPKFCVLWNTVPFWVNHPQLHLLRLLRRKNHSIQHSNPMWGDMGGGPRSRALFPSFWNKGSNFAPVSRNVTWATSLPPPPPLGSFILSAVKSEGGEVVVEIRSVFLKGKKGIWDKGSYLISLASLSCWLVDEQM